MGSASVRVMEHPTTKQAVLVAGLTPATSLASTERRSLDGRPMSLRDALESFDVNAALNASRELLPEALVPLAAVAMESLPLLPSGKVDQSSIPEPDWQNLAGASSNATPRTPMEVQIQHIWAEALNTPNLSITAVSFSSCADAEGPMCQFG